MSSSLVEDWSEGDFDLDHTSLRTDYLSLHDDHDDDPAAAHVDDYADWDHDQDQDGSDEQTDTIKLSSIAGSALKQLLEASKASASSLPCADLKALDPQLRPPALNLAHLHDNADADRLDIMRFANSHDDVNTGSTASLSTSASTSYRSMMGLSTDLTDPDSPNSKNGTRKTTSTSSCSSDRARSDLGFHSSEPDDAIDELDFELAPNMNNLSLCSSLSRARSNASLSHVSRDLWDEDPALGVPGSSNQPATSSKSISGESDADDEHEDLLDGLDLQGSIFEPQPSLAPAAAQPVPLLKAKLEAMLDLKRSGRHPDSSRSPSHVTDSDSGIAAGLVITDDVDLSPSRIAVRGLSHSRPKPSFEHIANSRLSAHTITPDGANERQHSYHAFSSHHQHHRTPTGEAASQQPKSIRTEPRGPRRSLRFKRSTSDLQTHMSAASANAGPSAPNRPQNRGSQLTRKRSLPSMRTSPPAAAGSVNVAAVQLGAHTIAVRQRHNSGTSTSSSVSRNRSKNSSRLTDSTAASRARAAETAADQLARLHRDTKAPARPSTPVSIPTRSPHHPPPRISVSTRSKTRSERERQGLSAESQPAARLLKRSAPYGSGAELDGIADLTTSTSPSVKPTPLPPSSASANAGRGATKTTDDGASQSQRGGKSKRGGRRHPKSKPGLIRSLGVGGSPTQKTVKGMRWNAQALRWEGNEAVLRDFDQVIQSSTRPALISQITGSSTSSRLTHAAGYTSPISPESSTLMNSIASGARVVGDMLFDPVQMRWVRKSGDEEDDVFAQFDEALDEGDASHDAAGLGADAEGDNTLRARRTRSTEAFSQSSNPWTRLSAKEPAAAASDDEAYERSLNRKHDQAIRRALSRGAFAASVGIDRDIWDACVQAEKRHALEVGAWLPHSAPYRLRTRTRSHTSDRALTMDEIERPRPHLYYLEKIAKSIPRSDTK